MSDQRAVAVYGSSETPVGTPQWVEAFELGKRLAGAGLAVITGGYGGTMEAVSNGAADGGGHVIGVTAPSLFPGRPRANPYVVELIEARTLTERIGTMMERASGVIVLPGSIGTATELLVAWNTNHIARRGGSSPLPTVAVGEDWAALAQVLTKTRADASDIHLAGNVEEAATWLLDRIR